MTNKTLYLPVKQGEYTVGAIDVPTADAGEVLIKVEAVGLNPADWAIKVFGVVKEEYPAILGIEGAGIIEAVGEGVAGFAKGDRVLFTGSFDERYATFKQFTVERAEHVVKIPDWLSFDEAASISVGLCTAAFALFNQDKTATPYSACLYLPWEAGGRGKYAGKPILVFGGASTVGQNVLQIAKLAGFSPIIATASLHNTAYLKELGATHVLDRNFSTETLRVEIGKITSAPIDLVYVAVPMQSETQLSGYALLAPGGLLVVCSPTHVIPQETLSPDKAVKCHIASRNLPHNVAVARSLYQHLPELLAQGAIKPNHVEVLSGGFDGVAEGLNRLQRREVSAKKLVARPFETA